MLRAGSIFTFARRLGIGLLVAAYWCSALNRRTGWLLLGLRLRRLRGEWCGRNRILRGLLRRCAWRRGLRARGQRAKSEAECERSAREPERAGELVHAVFPGSEPKGIAGEALELD